MISLLQVYTSDPAHTVDGRLHWFEDAQVRSICGMARRDHCVAASPHSRDPLCGLCNNVRVEHLRAELISSS